MANPLPLVWVAAQKNLFSNLIKDALVRHPCSPTRPWSLVLYNDEARPGNRLKSHNARAVQAVYAAFLEWGPWNLSKEDWWLPLGSVASDDLSDAEAGIAQLVGGILKLMFDPSKHDARYSGLQLTLADGSTTKIWFELKAILADESALHQIWLSKGSAGVKCCLMCKNVVGRVWMASELCSNKTYFQNYHDIERLDQCDLADKQFVMTILRELKLSRPPAMTKGKYEERQKILGWSDSDYSMLSDGVLQDFLDPCTMTCFDWGHNILQGCFQLTIFCAMRDIRSSGIRPEHVYDFLSTWCWPRRLGSGKQCGVEMFGPKRSENNIQAKSWKCTQSEALSIHAPLAHYFRVVVLPSGVHDAVCEAVLSLSVLIHILWHHPKHHIPADVVLDAAEKYVTAYRKAFGPEWMVWKHHSILHHAQSVRRLGHSPNCIALERKHKSLFKMGRRPLRRL